MSNKDLRRKRIRARLAQYDMTAAMLADMLGINEGHLSKVINSRINVPIELASRIARALKTTTSYLKLNK